MPIRRATAADAQQYFDWANESSIRANSYSAQPIAWETHIRWFNQKLSDSSVYLYLFLNEEGEPAGQIRFDVNQSEAVMSYAIGEAHRGKGYGRQIMVEGMEHLAADYPPRPLTIVGYVKNTNIASKTIFNKLGFIAYSTDNYPDSTRYELVLDVA